MTDTHIAPTTITVTAIIHTCGSWWTGVAKSSWRIDPLPACRMLLAPLVDLCVEPERSAANLHRPREVRRSIHEVVDALPVDAEACCDLVGGEVAGDMHGATIPARSSRATANLGVVQLLQGGFVSASQAKRICKIDGCGRAHCARGLCRRHYVAAHKNGTVAEHEFVRPPAADEAERFFSKVDAAGPCWEWTGGVNENGYGRFARAPGHLDRLVYAHRWVWENLVGPIPGGLTLDHLCRNTICVNPDHLEPVSQAVNSSRLGSHVWCASGRHRLSESGYTRPNGSRFCGECSRERNREWIKANRPSKGTRP